MAPEPGRSEGHRRRLRWLGIGLLAALLGLFIAHALYWRELERRVEQGLAQWVADERAAGWQVRIGATARRGYPLAARLLATDVSLEGGTDALPGGLAWHADQVALSIRLFDPRRLAIEPAGTGTLRLSLLPPIAYTAERIQAEIPFEPGAKAHQLSVRADNLRAGLAPGGAGGQSEPRFTIGLLQAAADRAPAPAPGAPALGLALSAEAIGLPAGAGRLLGGHISSLSLDATLIGAPPAMAGLARRASAWRDGGGSLAVRHLALGWGPLGLTGQGTAGLDAHLQPIVTGSARAVGYAETLDKLAAGGLITAGAATTVKALASLMARVPQGGGPAEIEVPLSVKDGMLSIRQIPLTRIPALIWPPD